MQQNFFFRSAYTTRIFNSFSCFQLDMFIYEMSAYMRNIAQGFPYSVRFQFWNKILGCASSGKYETRKKGKRKTK